MAEEKVFGKFPRTATEEVRAGIKEFRGKKYIDFRTYYMDKQGEWKPTKKGITLPTDFMPDLRKAVDAIEAEIEAMAKESGQEH
jgi:hypothetical protein